MNLLKDDVLHMKTDLDHIHADVEHLVGELGDRCKDCSAYHELLMHAKELDEHIHNVLEHVGHVQSEHVD